MSAFTITIPFDSAVEAFLFFEEVRECGHLDRNLGPVELYTREREGLGSGRAEVAPLGSRAPRHSVRALLGDT